MSIDNGSWEENRKLIFDRINTYDKVLPEILASIRGIEDAVTKNTMRTNLLNGTFGVIGGAIPVSIVLGILFLKGII